MGLKIDGVERKNNSRNNQKLKGHDYLNRIDLNKDIHISFFKNRFGDKKKEKFFSELGILLSSGLDISNAFRLIIEQEAKENERQVYKSIYENLLKGKNLSDSLMNSEKFSEYDFFSVKMGEESGQLSEVLNELSFFYAKKIKYKRKLISVLTYPSVVLIAAVGAVIFMLNFLVPTFVDVFKRTNSDLPGITKFIISLSKMTSEKLPLIIVLFLILVISIYINRRKEFIRRTGASILLKLPIFGNIFKLVYVERFLLSMVLLTKSKVSVVKSIGLAKRMIQFYPFEAALGKIEADLLHGKQLHESMNSFPIFDKKIVSLVRVGEEVNQLSSIFEKLNKQYSDDLDYKINNIGNLLEPILIIFIGLFVAIILIAMYLPIFQIGSNIR
ncbi:MAG TPA: type II secretion system F family protein [Bacteroidales bacterium]